MKLEKKHLVWLLIFILVFGGYFYAKQMREASVNNTAAPQNNVSIENTEGSNSAVPGDPSQNTNAAAPDNTSQNTNAAAPDNTSQNTNTAAPDNTSQNDTNISSPENTAQNGSAGTNTADSGNAAGNEANTAPQGPVYYTSDVLDKLTGTEIFNSTAIEHIFIGTVNSSGKGSGYHYAMISDAKGSIIEGTKSKLDKDGLYKANVEVDGHKKDSISTFYPDDWSPQQVVDAIAEARADALKTGEMSGDYHVGYSNSGIQIKMYLDSKNKVVTAFPVYKKGRNQ